MNEIKIQHKGNGAILTCITKYICTKVKAFHLCKYKTQGLTFVVFHHHFCKGLLNQNMQWLQTMLAQPFSSFVVDYGLFQKN
jgi:hypothetical protein